MRIIVSVIILCLLASSVTATQSTAHAQESDEPVVYPIPSAWMADETVDSTAFGEAAPPLEVVNANGDFTFTHLPDSGVIRILPDKTAGQPGRSLTLAWPITMDSTPPALEPGSVYVLSVSSRGFSPPYGVMLTVREFDGQAWSSSSTPMQAVAWSDYSVSRQISDSAVEVQVGLTWELADANSWIEFQNMALSIHPATTSQIELSPTDTPTPVGQDAVTDAAPTVQAPPGPLIVVTSTPTPVNVFAAATQMAQSTQWAQILGTATATPDNMVTATPTPSPLVVTSTPTPGNEATAVYIAAVATAESATTGTPTPLPAGVEVVVATATKAPTSAHATQGTGSSVTRAQASATARASNRSTSTNKTTPVYVAVDDLIFPTSTPTPPFPLEMKGKILFLSDYLAKNSRNPNAFMINPDGTGLSLLTSREFYDRAKEADAYSADGRFHAFNQREPLGDRKALIQVYFNDYEYESLGHQLTYFGDGTAWAPAFSPTDSSSIALVSSESSNDEIWLVRREQWPGVQLTNNDWEWDRSPSFSPDGTKIALESNRISGTRQIWVMDVSGANAYQVTNFPFEAWEPVWVKYVD